MKRKIAKILSLSLALILCVCSFSTAFAADGVPDGYIPIYTAVDLNNIRNNLSGKFILMNDIDLSAYENWQPLGETEKPFTGTLKADGYSIKNLKAKSDITTPQANGIGLFGFIKGAEISGINLVNISINIDYPYNSTYFVGGITGVCFDSTVNSCKVSGSISAVAGGSIYIGGVSGYVLDENKSTKITNCTSQVNIKAVGENNDFWQPEGAQHTCVGGIVGSIYSADKIYKCRNSGDISVKAINAGVVGGIAGNAENTEISMCKNTGKITAEGSCKISEAPVDTTLWGRIISFFADIFERFLSIFK